MFKIALKLGLVFGIIALVASQSLQAGAEQTWQVQGVKAGNPTRIVAPQIGLDLPVVRGKYNTTDKTWEITDKSAFFSGSSANNVGGQTVIYAHNYQHLFGNIHNIKKGDAVRVSTDSGSEFEYQLTERYETIPQNGAIYKYSGAPRLVLITCSGPNDSRRLIEIFKPVSSR